MRSTSFTLVHKRELIKIYQTVSCSLYDADIVYVCVKYMYPHINIIFVRKSVYTFCCWRNRYVFHRGSPLTGSHWFCSLTIIQKRIALVLTPTAFLVLPENIVMLNGMC